MGKVVQLRHRDDEDEERNFFPRPKGNTRKVVKKGGKRSEKQEIEIEGVEEFAVVKIIERAIISISETLAAQIKDEMADHFASCLSKPPNFTGVENKARASCEMRKRSSRSALNDLEIELLDKYNIPYDEVEIGDAPTTYIINPDYKDNEKLIRKVNEALQSVRGIPNDFIQLQEPPTQFIVSDDSINSVFKKTSPGIKKKLLAVVATMAIKPRFEGNAKVVARAAKELLENFDFDASKDED